MNNYIPTGYENHKKFKGLIIPKGNDTFCQAFNCSGLNCDKNCLFGNEKMLSIYLLNEKRKQKLKKIQQNIK